MITMLPRVPLSPSVFRAGIPSCLSMSLAVRDNQVQHLKHKQLFSTCTTMHSVDLNHRTLSVLLQNSKDQPHLCKLEKRYGQSVRCHATKPKQDDVSEKKEVVQSRTGEKPFSALTTAQKVKQAGKDATYTGVVIVGIGVTGLMFYAIGRELFSGQSPSGVYGRALKECKKNTEVVAALGEPLKGYGEMNRRGRRRYVSHTEFLVDNVKYMRMKFYIEGPYGKGTVHLEAKQNESGKYEYRYLFVQLDQYPRRTIVVQDNR